MRPQPFKEMFDSFFKSCYPNHFEINATQRNTLQSVFYVGGLLVRNSAMVGGNSEMDVEQNEKILVDIQLELQRFGIQTKRTPRPPIKGKLGDVFNRFLSKDIVPTPPSPIARLDMYSAMVAGMAAMLGLLTNSIEDQDDIAMTRMDIINDDLMSNTGIEAWHVPEWNLE